MARVGLIGENSNAYLAELINIWNKKNCAVLIDWRIPEQTALEMLREANVQVCIIEESLIPKFKCLLTEIKIISYKNDSQRKTELVSKAIYEKYKENYTKEEAIILYSSGTTGKAKGIILTHYAISHNADSIIDYLKPSRNECIYIAKSITHSSTVVGEILVSLKAKIKMVIGPTIVHPRLVINSIKNYLVSILVINPTILRQYTNELNRNRSSVGSLKEIYVCGAPLDEKTALLAKSVFENVKIYNAYGLSEAGPRVTVQTADFCTLCSAGRPIKGVEVVIVDNLGNILPSGECGIIHVKTKSLFSGYVSGDKGLQSYYKNWLNTGDIGKFNERGELFVVGRTDDVINMSAHKIYPYTIENAILSYPNIDNCKVVKIKHLDREILACLYVGESIDNKIMTDYLKKKIMIYEMPQLFIKCDEIPKNHNGKISSIELQKLIKSTISKLEDK